MPRHHSDRSRRSQSCPACVQGFAYVEFVEVDAVSNAMLLDNTALRGREIKVRMAAAWGRMGFHGAA